LHRLQIFGEPSKFPLLVVDGVVLGVVLGAVLGVVDGVVLGIVDGVVLGIVDEVVLGVVLSARRLSEALRTFGLHTPPARVILRRQALW